MHQTPGNYNPVSPGSSEKFIGKIPLRNIWLLMFYASDLFQQSGTKFGSVEERPDDIPDLIAEMLVHIVERRLKRSLNFGYEPKKTVLSRVRGKIDHLRTFRHQLLQQGKIACKFESFSVNTPRNRLVRAALYTLSRVVKRSVLRQRCKNFGDNFKQLGVSGVKPSMGEITSNRFGRHDSEDRLMVAAAKLAFDLALPSEIQESIKVLSPHKEKVWVRKLFEKAIAGFYKVVLSPTGWKTFVGKTHKWPIEKFTPGISLLLQNMRTDAILENHKLAHRIIIDTKFNEIIKSGYHRENAFRTGYVYQMYAYLRSQETKQDPLSLTSSGMLLHPAVSKHIDETVLIQNHAIRFVTVDLTQPAVDIREQLLDIVEYPNGF